MLKSITFFQVQCMHFSHIQCSHVYCSHIYWSWKNCSNIYCSHINYRHTHSYLRNCNFIYSVSYISDTAAKSAAVRYIAGVYTKVIYAALSCSADVFVTDILCILYDFPCGYQIFVTHKGSSKNNYMILHTWTLLWVPKMWYTREVIYRQTNIY